MQFSGKMCLMIILRVTKNHGFTLCLEDTIFEKAHGGQIDPPSRFRVSYLIILGGFLGALPPFVIEQASYYELHLCWFHQ